MIEWKEMIFIGFVVYIIINLGYTYPIFGIVLIVSIVALIVASLIMDSIHEKETEKNQEKQKALYQIKLKQQQKKEKRKSNRNYYLRKKLAEEIELIIESNINIIATAYRTCVTSNSFGKKNYDKFISELTEFIEDNSKFLEEVNTFFEKNYDNTEIVIVNASVIKFIEEKIEEL